MAMLGIPKGGQIGKKTPHPQGAVPGRVSKDEEWKVSWFETRAKSALLTMRV
jgi:hypothetical protein